MNNEAPKTSWASIALCLFVALAFASIANFTLSAAMGGGPNPEEHVLNLLPVPYLGLLALCSFASIRGVLFTGLLLLAYCILGIYLAHAVANAHRSSAWDLHTGLVLWLLVPTWQWTRLARDRFLDRGGVATLMVIAAVVGATWQVCWPPFAESLDAQALARIHARFPVGASFEEILASDPDHELNWSGGTGSFDDGHGYIRDEQGNVRNLSQADLTVMTAPWCKERAMVVLIFERKTDARGQSVTTPIRETIALPAPHCSVRAD